MLKPITDHVLVKYEQPKQTTPGGLHIPDVALDNSRMWGNRGEVLAVGPLVVDVKPGDTIYFKRRGGTAVDPDMWSAPIDERGDSLIVLRCPPVESKDRPSDILAVEVQS